MKPFFTTGIFAIATLFGLSMATNVLAESPSNVRVRSINWAGSGCPVGSTSYNFTPDQLSLSILFDQYIVETGPDIPSSYRRKGCQISIDIGHPEGWSYTITSVKYLGHFLLEESVQAKQSTTYYFQGYPQSARMESIINGPVNRDFILHERPSSQSYIWSSCTADRSLNIDNEIKILSTNSSQRGHIAVDSIDGHYKIIYGINWRHC